jgi:KUP system potassium uptake protein
VYMSSVVTKVPQGGWLPFVVAIVVTLIMFTWNMGCQAKYQYELKNQITKDIFATLLQEVGGVRVPGACFFFTDLMSGVPPVVQHYVSNVRSLHRVLVFTTVRFLPVKTVLPTERFLVGKVGFEGVYRCVARYGYKDQVMMQNTELIDQFLITLREYLERIQHPSNSREASNSVFSDDEDFHSPNIAGELSMLQQAKEDGAVYVMGRGEIKVSKKRDLLTRLFVGTIYKFLRANCRSEVSMMNIPYANFLEIGMLYEI